MSLSQHSIQAVSCLFFVTIFYISYVMSCLCHNILYKLCHVMSLSRRSIQVVFFVFLPQHFIQAVSCHVFVTTFYTCCVISCLCHINILYRLCPVISLSEGTVKVICGPVFVIISHKTCVLPCSCHILYRQHSDMSFQTSNRDCILLCPYHRVLYRQRSVKSFQTSYANCVFSCLCYNIPYRLSCHVFVTTFCTGCVLLCLCPNAL